MKILISAAIISLMNLSLAQAETVDKVTSALLKKEISAVERQIQDQIRHDIRMSVLNFIKPTPIDVKFLLATNDTNSSYQAKKK
jgi:hypothetical protein